MAFLNWLLGRPAKPSVAGSHPAPTARDKSGERPAADPSSVHETSGRSHRHARRELLYVVIRESMTKAGVLSSRYKFKVLSLDQRGNEFMVMMDVAEAMGGPAQLAAIEKLLIQNARVRLDMRVPAVYWRVDPALVIPPAPVRAAAALKAGGAPRFEPIQAEEVHAFKQALASAARSEGPATEPTYGVQRRSGPRAPAAMPGFEDTERPGSPSSPVLSTTQYGDLN